MIRLVFWLIMKENCPIVECVLMLPAVVISLCIVPDPVRTEDFYNFDLIIGMDDRNIDDLQERAPGVEEQKKIHRMTEYCRRIPADHVPDPYYGGAEGFEYVLDILEDACSGLLEKLGC